MSFRELFLGNKFWELSWLGRTLGVVAFKFPFSILTQIQDHDRSQKIRKIAKNYVPISDFATRLLNLRKPEKSKKFSKKKYEWRFTWILNFVLLKLSYMYQSPNLPSKTQLFNLYCSFAVRLVEKKLYGRNFCRTGFPESGHTK